MELCQEKLLFVYANLMCCEIICADVFIFALIITEVIKFKLYVDANII